MKVHKETNAMEKALKHFDNSPTKMAEAIRASGKEVTRQTLSMLATRKHPLSPKYVPEVSKITKIPKKVLNSEVDWELAKETP
jgi:hypothetical protein